MMDSKHTKGPWFLNSKNDEILIMKQVRGDRHDLESDSICKPIASINTKMDTEEWTRNSLLILNAPELLEMLDSVMEDMNSIVDNQKSWGIKKTEDHCIDIQSKIHELIEKTLGEK